MDKIEKIRQEIERLINEYKPAVAGIDELTGAHIILAKLLSFIDSLPEEHDNKDLNDGIKKFIEKYGYERGGDRLLIAIVARHFAQWGAEHLKK